MRLAAVVISFDFSNEALFENVQYYLHNIDLLIIWDNTPHERKKIKKEFWLDKNPKIQVLGTGKNEGIGYALNQAIECAQKERCTHLLMMDQDSIWRDFRNYRNEIELDIDTDVALYAPTIADAESDFVFWCNKPDLYVITSGSVLNLSFVPEIGLFNEKMFIDEVDNEYCIRVVQKGFHIKVYENHFLFQHFGNKEGKSFLARQTANYSPFRTYHQVRNRLWMWKMYPRQLSWRYHARTILVTILKRIAIITLYEKNKKAKLEAIAKGFRDGITKSPVA